MTGPEAEAFQKLIDLTQEGMIQRWVLLGLCVLNLVMSGLLLGFVVCNVRAAREYLEISKQYAHTTTNDVHEAKNELKQLAQSALAPSHKTN